MFIIKSPLFFGLLLPFDPTAHLESEKKMDWSKS